MRQAPLDLVSTTQSLAPALGISKLLATATPMFSVPSRRAAYGYDEVPILASLLFTRCPHVLSTIYLSPFVCRGVSRRCVFITSLPSYLPVASLSVPRFAQSTIHARHTTVAQFKRSEAAKRIRTLRNDRRRVRATLVAMKGTRTCHERLETKRLLSAPFISKAICCATSSLTLSLDLRRTAA